MACLSLSHGDARMLGAVRSNFIRTRTAGRARSVRAAAPSGTKLMAGVAGGGARRRQPPECAEPAALNSAEPEAPAHSFGGTLAQPRQDSPTSAPGLDFDALDVLMGEDSPVSNGRPMAMPPSPSEPADGDAAGKADGAASDGDGAAVQAAEAERGAQPPRPQPPLREGSMARAMIASGLRHASSSLGALSKAPTPTLPRPAPIGAAGPAG